MVKFLILCCIMVFSIDFSKGEDIESINDGKNNCNFPQIISKIWIKYNGITRCGGVLISPRHVLTLQSCIADQKKIKTTIRDIEKTDEKTNSGKNIYTTFKPDEYLKVDCNSKLYDIKILKSHKLVRPRGYTWKIYTDHVAIIELTQKVELADAENDESNFSIPNVFGPPVKSNEYLRFVAFFTHENNMLVKKYIQTTHQGICQNYTDVVFYDIVCGLFQGDENRPCQVFPGDPIFDNSMRIVGLMKDSYTFINRSMPIQFLSLHQHASWIKKFVS